jgi:hypothetical protein
MKIAGWIAVAIALATTRTGVAKPRPGVDELRDRAVVVVDRLAKLDDITAHDVADIVGRKLVATEQVTSARREARLESGPVFSAANVIVGGPNDAWRVVDLAPDPALGLTLDHFEHVLLDAPYEAQPWIIRSHPPVHAGTEHRFLVRAGELVIHANMSGAIERVIVTTARTLATGTTTWRTKRIASSRPSLRPGR